MRRRHLVSMLAGSRRRLPFLTLGALLVLVPLAGNRIQGQAGQTAAARVVALRGGTRLRPGPFFWSNSCHDF